MANIKDCIETSSGIFINVMQPSVNDITIEDMAHSLANNCRYAGHCKRFFSIAEHSVNVSYILQNYFHTSREIAFCGLLHDASEGYLVDIPTPLKRKLFDYQEIEERMMNVIFERFRVPYTFGTMPDRVHQADVLALRIEAYNLLPSQGYGWNVFANNDIPLLPKQYAPHKHLLSFFGFRYNAEKAFLKRFYELYSL
jgi:uncharacterized protein